MAKFDRYLLSQLMVLFGFFALVLVMVYWVNQAVRLFDQLIANGHSAMVFLEFSALTLPNVILLVLPIAAFAAAVYCANRLASDSELVVVQTTGFSPYQLVRPVLLFGVIVGVMVAMLSNVLVPASLIRLADRQAEISGNSTARFLQEGRFLHPSRGITFYIKDISPDGVMGGMFLSDSRDPEQKTSYSATRAMLVRSDSGPKLIMLNGMVQNLRLSDQTLSTTRFSEFVFDIAPLLARGAARRISPRQMPTSVLLNPQPNDIKSARSSRAALLQLGHGRIAQAVQSVVLVLVGFSALLIGNYSRFGLWRQILAALLVFIALKTLDNILNDMARQDADLWPLVYGSSVAGFAAGYFMLWLSTKPALFVRLRARART